MKLNRSFRSLLLLLLSLLSTGALQPAYAAKLECEVVPYIMKAYLQNHYEHKELTDKIKQQTVEQFIRTLDPSKSMLLQSDVDKIKSELPKVFATMNQGNCGLLEEHYKLLLDRTKETEAYIKSYVGKEYKLDESAEFTLNSDKRSFPKDQAEKEALLRNMVHFQMSNYLLDGSKLEDAKKQLVHRYELITKRATERNGEAVLVMYMEAFAQALDPHSSYLSKDSLEDFEIQMRLSLEGIGASLSSQDGYTVIEQIIPGGGAARSGQLKPKDKIIAVAQDGKTPENIIDMDLRDVVKKIRGKKGTRVKLTILRQGDKVERFDVTIVRDKIDLKDQAAKITYETKNVDGKKLVYGVIDLPSFYGGGGKNGRSSYEDVKRLLTEAKAKKVDGIILDLSRNGGGLLDDAVKLAGLFIREGGIVSTQTTGGKIELLRDEDESIVYNGPLVVLTSRFSASASEILAGALRDYGRAVVIGHDHTFGKGTVQVMAPLPSNLGAMKVTTGMYFLPQGYSTQHTGVSADIVLPFGFDSAEVGEKHLDYSLNPRKISPFLSDSANSTDPNQRWTPVGQEQLAKLIERSKARIAENPKFAELKKALDKSLQRQGAVKLADIRKDFLEEKKKAKKNEEKVTGKKRKKPGLVIGEDEEKDPLFLQESMNVLTDLIALQSEKAPSVVHANGVEIKN